MGHRYFDAKGRPVDEERIAREWMGRNRERAMQAMGMQKATPRPFEIDATQEPGSKMRVRVVTDRSA